MNYLEWNNAISEFLFNEEKGDEQKRVFIFVTEIVIIKIGKKNNPDSTDEQIFNDFLESITNVDPDPIAVAKDYHKQWLENPDAYNSPPFIACLILFVLPLTVEAIHEHYNANNYYDRLNDYFHEKCLTDINYEIGTRQFSDITSLWKTLEEWSIDTKNTEHGIFEIQPFNNQRWVHVGHPLSQCLLSEKSIKRLKILFEKAGLVPNVSMSKEKCRSLLLNNARIIKLNENDVKRISELDELGVAIINFVLDVYNQWDGDTIEIDVNENSISRAEFRAVLKLCCNYVPMSGVCDFYYRLYAEYDYPSDLKFEIGTDPISCSPERYGWSKPLMIEYQEELEIKDKINQWLAKFPKKDVHILINGSAKNLDGFIEINNLVIKGKMLLIVSQTKKESIEIWGKQFEDGVFKPIINENIPNDMYLFECENPDIPHPDIPHLSFKENHIDKVIKVKNGLKISPGTYLNKYLPIIELDNGTGDEDLYLEIGNDMKLLIKNDEYPVWYFNDFDSNLNEKFKIRSDDDESLKGDNRPYRIVDYNYNNLNNPEYSSLVIKDIYGSIIDVDPQSIDVDPQSKSIQGLSTRGLDKGDKNRMLPYIQFCQPQMDGVKQDQDHDVSDLEDDVLLNYLTYKRKLSSKEFNKVFETIYYESFDKSDIKQHENELGLYITNIKRFSMYYLNHMGHIDIQYQNINKIQIHEPEIINIATNYGTKAVLLGGRNPIDTNQFLENIEQTGYQVDIFKQDHSLNPFLLPNNVLISGTYKQKSTFFNHLISISKKHKIKYDFNKFCSLEYGIIFGGIDEYESSLSVIPFHEIGSWPARVFEPLIENFVPINISDINKEYALVQYKLNEYTFRTIFWKNNEAYEIDKSMGRFILLHKYEKNIIYYSRKNSKKLFCEIFIPSTIPLPYILNRSLIFFSGFAPRREKLKIKDVAKWYNVYEGVPYSFAINILKNIGQAILKR